MKNFVDEKDLARKSAEYKGSLKAWKRIRLFSLLYLLSGD